MDDFRRVCNDYLDAFGHLPKEEKRREIVNKIKNINMIMEDLSRRVNIPEEVLFSKDTDQLEESFLEDDYLKALLVHLITLENLLGKYLEKTIQV